jgi:hypothetical protein
MIKKFSTFKEILKTKKVLPIILYLFRLVLVLVAVAYQAAKTLYRALTEAGRTIYA